MQILQKGRYSATLATTAQDLADALELRRLCFGLGAVEDDAFDAVCTQVIVRDGSQAVCAFRMLALTAAELEGSYAAQFYDLRRLKAFPGKMIEIGRFCMHPNRSDPDILRVAWGAITAYVDQNDVRLLFGCSSFEGVDPTPYLDAFALLRYRHLAPERWMPGVKSPEVFRYATQLRQVPEIKAATAALPPLLRSYLMIGGWVSDHAVIDSEMNTVHVFTGVEIGVIPPARKRLLRAVLN